MAASINLEHAGPTVLKYTVSDGGQGERTKAQILKDCVNGPLKTFLAGVPSNGVPWSDIWLDGRVDVTLVWTFGVDSGVIPKGAVTFSGDKLYVLSDSTGPNGVLTIRFIPTPG